MQEIKTELGGSWKTFLLSVPLDVITFLFLLLTSGGLAWQYLGQERGKNPALLLLASGLLFALYYIFLRRIFLENHLLALGYIVLLSALVVFLPVIHALVPLAVFVLLGAATYWTDPHSRVGNYNGTLHGLMAQPAYARDKLIEVPVDDIYHNINGVYVQQFLANTKSMFEAYRRLYREEKAQGIPEMISAYPRRLLKHPLSQGDIEAAIKTTIKETNLDAESVSKYIKEELAAFSKTQRKTTVFGYEKVNLREVTDELERGHSDVLYKYRPLHYADLKKISEDEGLEVIDLKGLEILAGLIAYTGRDGERKYAILMKEDADVHPALKEFAMAHELGHWFAHIRGKGRDEIEKSEFYLNSLHDLGQFEDEANKVALITLFPTPYLTQGEVNKTLSKESVFEDYIEGMRDPEGQLKTNMLGFIKMRIESYQKYRYTWLQQTRLPDKPLSRQEVRPLANYLDARDIAWAELNDKYIVVDANENFARVVGITRKELLDMNINVKMLSEPHSRGITAKQLEVKRKDLTPKFYLTRYRNLRTKEITPVSIYTFPIVEGVANNTYAGSFGIVTPVDKKTLGSA